MADRVPAAGAALLAAAGLPVDRGPGAPLGLVLRHAVGLVSLRLCDRPYALACRCISTCRRGARCFSLRASNVQTKPRRSTAVPRRSCSPLSPCFLLLGIRLTGDPALAGVTGRHQTVVAGVAVPQNDGVETESGGACSKHHGGGRPWSTMAVSTCHWKARACALRRDRSDCSRGQSGERARGTDRVVQPSGVHETRIGLEASPLRDGCTARFGTQVWPSSCSKLVTSEMHSKRCRSRRIARTRGASRSSFGSAGPARFTASHCRRRKRGRS
jgi:hypothetical protein